MDVLKGIISARNKKPIAREESRASAEFDLHDAPAVSRYVQAIADSQAIEENPQKLRDIIESIEATYLQEPAGFQRSASSYELDKFRNIPTLTAIDERRAELLCQHRAVSKKLGESILQNEAAYRTELKRVIELKIDVEGAARTAQSARGALHGAQTNFTTRSLKLLADCARRRRALHVLRNLNVLRTLKDTEIHLKEMLIEDGDFLAAIFISIQFTTALRQFDTLRAARDLHGRLQDSLLMIDEALNRAVKRCCAEFVSSDYLKIRHGFALIGKQHLFVEQLQSAFSSLLHTHATHVLHTRFGGSSNANSLNAADADGQSVPNPHTRGGSVSLPTSASAHEALATLVDFCAYFFKLFVNYRAMLFVEVNLESIPQLGQSELPLDSDLATIQRLSSGRHRLWAECEARVRNLLAQIDFQSFKIDEFVRLLRIVQLLCSVGDEFLATLTLPGESVETHHDSATGSGTGTGTGTGSGPSQLSAAATNQSLVDVLQRVTSVYFRNFHRASLEQLRLFLEHEVWELCPVLRADTLALERIWQQNVTSASNGVDSSDTGEAPLLNAPNRFDLEFERSLNQAEAESTSENKQPNSIDCVLSRTIGRLRSPFDANLVSGDGDGDGDDGEKREASEMDQDALDAASETQSKRKSNDTRSDDEAETRRRTGSASSQSVAASSGSGIITSATSLEVLRLLTKYLEVARLLRPIASEVSHALTQLFEYYLFTVYTFFATRLPSSNDFVIEDEENNAQRAKLLSTLQRIKKWISDLSSVPPTITAVDQRPFGVPSFHLEFELRNNDSLCGLTKRIVATESLLFLAGQFEHIVPYLSVLIPSAKRPSLAHFQSHTLGVVGELRPFAFLDVARGALAYERVLALCRANGARWDAREIATQHSDYIDVLLGEFQLLRIRIRDTKRALAEANAARIPHAIKCFVFARALRYSATMLVDCFTVQSGRCTNEGRALMQLDFQQFVVQVEKILPKRLAARLTSATASGTSLASTNTPSPYANTLKQCREYVETYVKAFYFTEDQIEAWLREQHSYRAEQLTALVRSMPHLSKRTKQRLQLIIDEQAANAAAAAAAAAFESNNNSSSIVAVESQRESSIAADGTPAKQGVKNQAQASNVSIASPQTPAGSRPLNSNSNASNHSASPQTQAQSSNTRKLANIFHKSNS